MGVADPRRAYAILKRWYRYASAQAPKPSRTDMENFRRNFQTLYQKDEPHSTGLTLATHVDPVKLNNNIPSDAEVEAAV